MRSVIAMNAPRKSTAQAAHGVPDEETTDPIGTASRLLDGRYDCTLEEMPEVRFVCRIPVAWLMPFS